MLAPVKKIRISLFWKLVLLASLPVCAYSSPNNPQVTILAPVAGQKISLFGVNPALTVKVAVHSAEPIQSVLVYFDENGDGQEEVKAASQVGDGTTYQVVFSQLSGDPGKRTIQVRAVDRMLNTGSAYRITQLISSDASLTRISTHFEDILGMGEVQSLAFSPDGKKVLVGGGEAGGINKFGIAFLFDLASNTVEQKFYGHLDQVTAVAYFPPTDGHLIEGCDIPHLTVDADPAPVAVVRAQKSITTDGTIEVGPGANVEFIAGEEILFTPGFSAQETFEARISPCPLQPDIATASLDGTVMLWNSTTGELLRTLRHIRFDEISPKYKPVYDLAVSPDGSKVLTGTSFVEIDNQNIYLAWLWDALTGDTIRSIYSEISGEKHTRNVTAVAFSSTGDSLLTGSEDHTVKLWRTNDGAFLHTFDEHTNDVNDLVISPDGTQFLSGGDDNKVVLTTFASQQQQTFTYGNQIVRAVAFSRNGDRIFASGRNASSATPYSIKMWDRQSGTELSVFYADSEGGGDNVDAIATSPISDDLLSGGDNAALTLWNTEVDTTFDYDLVVTNNNILWITAAHSGTRFLSLDTDKRYLIVRDLDTTAAEGIIEYKYGTNRYEPITAAAFSPDDTKILTAINEISTERKVVRWHANDRTPIDTVSLVATGVLSTFTRERIRQGRYGGQNIGMLGTKQVVFTWSVDSQEQLDYFMFPDDDVYSLDLYIDKKTLFCVTGHSDGTVRLWDVKNRVLVKSINFLPSQTTITTVSFSHDGKKVVFGGGVYSGIWNWHKETIIPLPQRKNINVAVFSPDDKQVFTGSGNFSTYNSRNGAFIWEVATGQKVRELKQGAPYAAAFSSEGDRIILGGYNAGYFLVSRKPFAGAALSSLRFPDSGVPSLAVSADGSRLFSGSEFDSRVTYWNLKTQTPQVQSSLSTTMGGNPITVDLSPDGTRALAGDRDGLAALLNPITGGIRHSFYAPGATDFGSVGVEDLSFSPDGMEALLGIPDRAALVWNLTSGDTTLSFRGNVRPVTAVDWSSDGSWIVAGSGATARIVKNHPSVDVAPLLFDTHDDEVTDVDLSPDGSLLLTGSLDTKARIWDAKRGVKPLHILDHPYGLASAVFSQSGSSVLTAGQPGDPRARLWNTHTGSILRTFEGHGNGSGGTAVGQAVFTQDDEQIITAGGDGNIMTWNAKTKPLLVDFPGSTTCIPNPGAAASECLPTIGPVAYSPVGNRILLKGSDRLVYEYRTTNFSLLNTIGPGPHTENVKQIVYNETGTRLLTVDGKGAYLWDANNGEYLGSNFIYPSNDLSLIAVCTSADFSPVDSVLVTGHNNDVAFTPGGIRFQFNHAALWDVTTAQRIGDPFVGHSGGIRAVAMSPDGTQLITGSSDRTARIWDVASRSTLLTLEHGYAVSCVDFSPDGSRVATGEATDGNFVYIWDAATGNLIFKLMHPEGIRTLHFSPDSKQVIATSGDNAYVWDITSGELLYALGHEGDVYDAHFSPDGKRVISGGQDNVAKLWEVGN